MALNVQISDLKKEINTKNGIIIDINKQANDQKEAANKKFSQLTDKYKGVLASNENLNKKNHDLVKELINADKELSSVKLSLHAVQLFDASKESASTGAQVQSSATDSGNASAPETIRKAVTLADLYRVVNDNDEEHKNCIKQVEAWQAWWADYSAAFNQVFTQPVQVQ